MNLQLVPGRHINLLAAGACKRIKFSDAALKCACAVLSSVVYGTAAADAATTSCETRLETREIGKFTTNPVDEASGLALSPDGRNFYVTNDSGDDSRFYRTRLDGGGLEEFRVFERINGKLKMWKAFDIEDLSVGPCPKPISGDCVALADIGDNRDRRKNIELAFIRLGDLPSPPSRSALRISNFDVTISRKLRLKYTDGPRNAEAFGILNSRFGVIVTKPQDRKSRATKPAGLYVVDFELSKIARVGELDVPLWLKDQGLASLVTGLSIGESSANSVRLVLLTYRDAIELVFETDILTNSSWPPRAWSVRSRTVLKIDALEQQEAIAFDEARTGFYYTSEQPFAVLGVKSASIRWAEKMSCR